MPWKWWERGLLAMRERERERDMVIWLGPNVTLDGQISYGNDFRIPLIRWSLYKYKCLWGIGGKGWSSSLQGRTSHTYTLRARLVYGNAYYMGIGISITRNALS